VTIESGVRVLIVDDDRSIRHTLRAVLEDEGYAVLEAGDGAEGLALVRASLHRLVVLLDLRMPGLDGAGVLDAVAADARLARRHAFILVTANLDAITRACSALLHRLDVPIVPKPFDLDPLLDLVDRAACGLLATATDPSLPARHTAR
jgi:CheY-like chemotaxis protein